VHPEVRWAVRWFRNETTYGCQQQLVDWMLDARVDRLVLATARRPVLFLHRHDMTRPHRGQATASVPGLTLLAPLSHFYMLLPSATARRWPQVLKAFDIPNPVSALELNIEPFCFDQFFRPLA
jgi:hypothetical protein